MSPPSNPTTRAKSTRTPRATDTALVSALGRSLKTERDPAVRQWIAALLKGAKK